MTGFATLKLRDKTELPPFTMAELEVGQINFVMLCRSWQGIENCIPPKFDGKVAVFHTVTGGCGSGTTEVRPRFKTGSKLFIQEAWSHDQGGKVIYKSDYDTTAVRAQGWNRANTLKAQDARHFIEITSIRLTKILDLTKDEVNGMGWLSREHYYKYWDGELKTWMKGTCEAGNNPWVWVYTAKVIEKP